MPRPTVFLHNSPVEHYKVRKCQQCKDCVDWCGRCLKRKAYKIAADYACEDFEGKIGADLLQ